MWKPKLLLHVEGAVMLLVCCGVYQQGHGSWLWFALLFFAPDLFMAGYLVNKRVGTTAYNLVHTYAAPASLVVGLGLAGRADYQWLGLIWLAHIGFDRMLGYGLKYETAFKDTHLQRV